MPAFLKNMIDIWDEQSMESNITNIDTDIYESIVKKISNQAENLYVDAEKMTNGTEILAGTETMVSYLKAEMELALELTAYGNHVSAEMVPILQKTEEMFLTIDADADAAIIK